MSGELPDGVRVVFFSAGDTAAPAGVLGLVETTEVLASLASGRFGLPVTPSDTLPLAVVDHAGRVRSRYGIDASGSILPLDGGGGPAADARFLVGIQSRPLLHAALNACSALLLSLGFVFVRRRKIVAHLICMVLAALVTTTFLVSYLQYHSHVGSTPFQGTGWIRPVYFGMLLSHTVLAAFVAPVAASLFWFAARRRFERHRRIARWALPVWLYVSITGVLIYFMLYVWFPSV